MGLCSGIRRGWKVNLAGSARIYMERFYAARIYRAKIYDTRIYTARNCETRI